MDIEIIHILTFVLPASASDVLSFNVPNSWIYQPVFIIPVCNRHTFSRAVAATRSQHFPALFNILTRPILNRSSKRTEIVIHWTNCTIRHINREARWRLGTLGKISNATLPYFRNRRRLCSQGNATLSFHCCSTVPVELIASRAFGSLIT